MPIHNEAVKKRRFREVTDIDVGVVPNAVAPYITFENQLLEVHKEVLVLKDFPMTLADATVGAGVKIFTFPQGRILIMGGVAKNITPKTTSVLASTLNASSTLSAGVGSTTQANGTLATTEQDVINTCAPVSSAVINVAGTPADGAGPSAPFSLDGTSTPIALFFNIGVPTATDIDADATILVDTQIEFVWALIGND